MSKTIKLRKGFDIKLKGIAEKILETPDLPRQFAIKPTDFHGITPKLLVRVDDKVKAGTRLFHDKNNPDAVFTSPVSGKVIAINRGERRKLLEIIIEKEEDIQYEQFRKEDPLQLSKEDIAKNIIDSGLWPFVKQRPYDIIAKSNDTPKAIFISGFESAPLSPDLGFLFEGEKDNFQTGINALSKFTEGKVHLTVNGNEAIPSIFADITGIQLNKIYGPHPAGNVGVQIHHIDPMNKGEKAWTISPLGVIMIGRLFSKGVYDASRVIALAGSEVKEPKYFKTITGAKLESIIENNIAGDNVRYISGNVLTGTKIEKDGFLSFYQNQVTVIPEGDHYEFFGWAMPGFKKYSRSRTFLSWLTPNKHYRLHTNLYGGKRAFVFTGQYEKVFPMDILPVNLLKAIIVKDIDQMEELGIYEVSPEDFALCEFVCTSKINSQEIVQEGIDLMIKELG